jgi:glycerate 2-kinase
MKVIFVILEISQLIIMFIQNFHDLATTPERKIVLELVEEAFKSIQPEEVFKDKIKRHRNVLEIDGHEFNLDDYDRLFLLGFGKGSAGNALLLEELILDKLTEGYVIDTQGADFKKIEFSEGTHPLPSEQNYKFTKKVIDRFSNPNVQSYSTSKVEHAGTSGNVNLTERDLVLVVICGGGSAMFVAPHSISLEKKIEVGKALLKSGATISQMNAVRKHLSDVKGGGLAQILFPATVATMIYSDVPGNDLSVIASGPTVKDPTTIKDALKIVSAFGIDKKLDLPMNAFVEKPHDKRFFENVHNFIVLSNETALHAMQKKARELKHHAVILSDRFESEAKIAGKKLISETHHNSILLVGGETTVKVVKEGGKGGRNQELVLGALPYVGKDITICSFDSDGWDNSENAGAIGDYKLVESEHAKKIDAEKYLELDSSFDFFKKAGGNIVTGRLPSNVSDLMIVLRK